MHNAIIIVVIVDTVRKPVEIGIGEIVLSGAGIAAVGHPVQRLARYTPV